MWNITKYPIICAPMAGVSTPELTATVSNAGGLGSFGAGLMSPEEIRNAIRKIKSLTDKPYNVNLFVPTKERATKDHSYYSQYIRSLDPNFEPQVANLPDFEEQIEVLVEEKIPVFSFTFGVPSRAILDKFSSAVVIGTATSLEEVEALQDVDYIVCQGKEAGGHRGTFLGELKDSLIPTKKFILNAKSKVPLIASGGIMDAAGIEEMLQCGAIAAQLGTVFVPSNESSASEIYKNALIEKKTTPTMLTRAFSGRWARTIANQFVCDLAPFDTEIPDYPIPRYYTGVLKKKNDAECISLWAGEGFAKCKRENALNIIKNLCK